MATEEKKKTTTKKAATKKPATKKAPAKKSTAKKSTAKKPVAKKKAAPKTSASKKNQQGFKVASTNQQENLLDVLSATPAEQQSTTKAKTPSKAKGSSKAKATKAPAKKIVKPARPQHKEKNFTKEEKVLYKRLEASFNYVANLTMVIEERTLDKIAVPDLTLGELHVLEVFNQEESMPMTKAANQLKITVGSLTTCVNRLVKKDYLFREYDGTDHRIRNVSTTLKAKKVLKAHDAFHREILLGVLDGVTIRDATKVMSQFERTLENYYNPKEKNYDKPIDTKKKKNI